MAPVGSLARHIPLLLVAYVCSIAAGVVMFLAWFATLFTGRLLVSFADFLAGNLRFIWRVNAYLLGLTTLPQLRPASRAPRSRREHGDLFRRPGHPLSRVRVFFRYFMVIPQVIVLGFVSIAAYVVLIIGWFAVLVRRARPGQLRAVPAAVALAQVAFSGVALRWQQSCSRSSAG